jgi:hypothetical protein
MSITLLPQPTPQRAALQPPRLLDQMSQVLRVQHYLPRNPNGRRTGNLACCTSRTGRRRNGPRCRPGTCVILFSTSRTCEPVIHGLLRQGETMNVIASSKIGKSRLVTDLALSVATGRPWLDAFPTEHDGDQEDHEEVREQEAEGDAARGRKAEPDRRRRARPGRGRPAHDLQGDGREGPLDLARRQDPRGNAALVAAAAAQDQGQGNVVQEGRSRPIRPHVIDAKMRPPDAMRLMGRVAFQETTP